MAYNLNSNNTYGGGYNTSNPYNNQSAPYNSQSSNPYNNQSAPYNSQSTPYNNHNSGYASRPGYGNVEMQPLNSAADPYGAPPERDPNAILNDCRAVGRAIDDLQSRTPELERVQQNYLSGSGASNRDIDALSADIMTGYRGLTERVRRIKGMRDAGSPRNRPQVENLDRRIRKAITDFQQSEAGFRRAVQEQQKRQYLIVKPDATEAEIREVTEAGGDQQIFQQALLNADRRGQAQSTLRNVQQRHDAIQQIERTMMELQQLFQDLDALVIEQEIPVQAIEQKAEETTHHLEQGTIHVGKAVDSARAARKKKWICLGISILILIIVLVIVFAVLAANGAFKGKN